MCYTDIIEIKIWEETLMKNAKRIISLLLALVMVLSVFTGCGKKATKGVAGDGKIVVGLPYSASGPDINQNELVKYISEKSGLEIEWRLYPTSPSDYKTKLQTSLLNKKEILPDVLLGMDGLGHYTINQLGEQGFIVDLKPLIDAGKAPNYTAALSKLDEKTQKYIQEKGTNTTDGKSFFAMPAVTVAAIDDQESMIYINQKWLDAVGMKAPTTVKELEAVCKAFKEKDPNGNGEADEMPMLDASTNPEIRNWLINAFVEYNPGAFNVDANGKVWDPLTTKEFRQALGFISDMTQKGYYDSASFTTAIADVKNYVSPQSGDIQVGIFGGHMETMTNANTDALDEFVSLKPLKDATGKGGYNIINDISVTWRAMITHHCVDTDEAIRFIDAWYEDEAVTRQRYGKKGEDWIESKGESPFGTESTIQIKNTQAFFNKAENRTLGNILFIMTPENYYNIADSEEMGSSSRQIQVTRLLKEQWANLKEGKKQVDTLEQLVYTQEEYEAREEKLADLDDYIAKEVIQFASAAKDVNDNAAWNTFQDQLQKRARGEMMEIIQNAYNRKVGK